MKVTGIHATSGFLCTCKWNMSHWRNFGASGLMVSRINLKVLHVVSVFSSLAPFMFCWANQHREGVFPSLQGLCQKVSQLMCDIDLHLCQELMKSVGMNCSWYYHMCCCWRPLTMCVTVAFVQIAPQFFSVFRVEISSFSCSLIHCWIWNVCKLILCSQFCSSLLKSELLIFFNAYEHILSCAQYGTVN
jgi:hypothetical protein